MTDILEPWPARGVWMHAPAPGEHLHDPESAEGLTAHLELPPTLRAPALARRFVRVVLAEWGFCDDGAYTAQLVVTELAANAVVHSGAAAGDDAEAVELSLTVAGDRVTIGLTDGSSIPPIVAALSEDGESGRGMSIVNRVAEAWGTAERARGKQVWARLRLPRLPRPPQGSNL